jgi:hypothetical protein
VGRHEGEGHDSGVQEKGCGYSVRSEGHGCLLEEWEGNPRHLYIYNDAISGYMGCLLGHDLQRRAL